MYKSYQEDEPSSHSTGVKRELSSSSSSQEEEEESSSI
jgi:hypothetical protein